MNIGHNGAAPGARAWYRTYPEKDCVMVVLANEESGQACMSAIERHLILGSGHGIRYFDESFDRTTFSALIKDATSIAKKIDPKSDTPESVVSSSTLVPSLSTTARAATVLGISASTLQVVEENKSIVAPSSSAPSYPLALQNNMSVTAKPDIPIDDTQEAPDPDSIPPAFRKKH